MTKIIIRILGLLLSYMTIYSCINQGSLTINREFIIVGLNIILGWYFSALLTDRNNPKFYQRKISYILFPILRSVIVQFLITFTIILFANQIFDIYILIYTILLFAAVESILITLMIFKKNINDDAKDNNKNIQDYKQADLIKEKISYIKLTNDNTIDTNIPFNVLEKLYNNNADINSLDANGKMLIVRSHNIGKSNEAYDLMIVKNIINQFTSINKTFKSYYDGLYNGGYLIISYFDLMNSENNNYAIKNISKTISKTEVWGRLSYIGFDILSDFKVKDTSYILAKKSKEISINKNPSRKFLILLNRVGFNGRIIKIFKIRTMYPYSEFIQKKVFEMNDLSSTGKFQNDFRITPLGKFLRKYWFDELPQLLNLLRGDIKLVGIRAMSTHYFSLYPKSYHELYKRVKPGFLSPIFDEDNDGFNQIVKIEEEYLKKYLKNPIRTDFIYCFTIIRDIIFKGVKSK